MELVTAGLGQDFDASVTELVVFRGKGILVDANFADGGFGRKLAAGKPVDIDLAAIWPSGRAGESLVRLVRANSTCDAIIDRPG